MTRVLIVDDHPLVRQGLTGVLADAPDIEVVGAVADGSLAAEAAEANRADIVLMDLSMPGMDGIEATTEVLARCPEVRVVVLTSFAEQARVVAALDAGAVGYLLKDTEPEDLVQAVRDAAAGNAPISPRAALALLPPRGARKPSPSVTLSPREREVLSLVAVGLPNKSVARQLQISEKTVKAHLTRIFAALGLYDRTSAAIALLVVLARGPMVLGPPGRKGPILPGNAPLTISDQVKRGFGSSTESFFPVTFDIGPTAMNNRREHEAKKPRAGSGTAATPVATNHQENS